MPWRPRNAPCQSPRLSNGIISGIDKPSFAQNPATTNRDRQSRRADREQQQPDQQPDKPAVEDDVVHGAFSYSYRVLNNFGVAPISSTVTIILFCVPDF